MAKSISIDGIDAPIVLVKRKGTKFLRITIKNNGTVRVSVPFGVPEFVAKQYVKSKAQWIQLHYKTPKTPQHGDHIGKSHILHVYSSSNSRNNTKITEQAVVVKLAKHIKLGSQEAHDVITKACDKALKKQADKVLIKRAQYLAGKHDKNVRSYETKRLQSRWGACDNHGNITLNIYLMQLDWQLIDYVIYHELAHLNHPHHQKSFWDEVKSMCPEFKARRKVLKSKETTIVPTSYKAADPPV